MKKVLFLVGFSLFSSLMGMGQYANNWIVAGQQYYKVPVAKTGIYRLTTASLQSAGFPVSSVDPRVVQMMHRGVQHAIFIQGEADAKFDASDYIEFYGERNDGTLDSLLYQPSSLQPHKYYNLYSDTAAYFLTWNLGAVRGKRITSFFQNNTTAIVKESSQTHTELNVFAAEYSGGNTIGSGEIQNSYFDEGEGWTDTFIRTGSSCEDGFKDYTIANLDKGVTGAGNPSIDVLLAGRDELNHTTSIWVGPTAGSLRQIASGISFVNFQMRHVIADLDWSDIGSDGKMVVHVVISCYSGVRDKQSVSYIKVTIPQSFDATGITTKSIQLNANVAAKSYVEFSNAPSAARVWDITDPATLIVIGTNAAAGILSAVVPNTLTPRTLLISNETLSAVVKPVSFDIIDPSSYDFVIITHNQLLTGAQSYASWRSSAEGGGYRTLVITTDQIYNQFNYGETSPLGIYQLVKFLVEKGPAQYLFLIGKGLDVSQAPHRKTSFLSTDMRDLVPSAGLPASDVLYSANLKGSGFVPTLSTGRLSASTNAQVVAYLNKVREVETSPVTTPWRKEGLHLSGGILADELIDFRSYMDGFKSIAEGPYWGANITTIGKHDPEAVKQINISDQVNAGVNLITFFGHSSPGTIDIDIGKVSDPKLGYDNPGKYPVFLINGCNAGNFFNNGTSFGEDWMLASGKGSRGFIAHSFFGYVQNLKTYSDLFYTVAFADSNFIQKGLGDVQREVASRYLAAYGTYMTNVTQVQEMLLLGDPTTKLFGTTKPDFETDNAAIFIVSLDNKPVTVASDSFAVRVIVRNLGAVKQTSLQMKLVRTYSDGFTESFLKSIPAVLHQDTIDFVVKKTRSSGSGSNMFTITLDYENSISELDESNNTGSASFIIPLGGTLNLYPVPYAIVNQTSVDFIFQSVNPLDSKRNYDLQIDTVNTFNSSLLKASTVSGKVLLKTTVPVTATDSTVYFWRTRLSDPKENESTLWSTSSFTLIRAGATGWTQRKFEQLNENSLEGLVEDNTTRRLGFEETHSDLLVTTYGWNNPASSLDVSVKINGTEFNIATEGDPCRNSTLNFISFNKTSLVPYPALDLGFQSVNTCGREPQVINSFTFSEMDNGSDHDILAMIDNIHSGDSVLVFSIGNINHQGWTSAMRAKLQQLGIDDAMLSSLDTGDPLVILGRKDAPAGTAKLYFINDPDADLKELQVASAITGRYTSGKMSSVLIGPALKWKQLVSKANDIQTSDTFGFSLWGVGANGQEIEIYDHITSDLDLTNLDPIAYPWLRLKLQTDDELNLTPVQLSQWLVLYDPMAEGVLLFDGPPEQQFLSEGQPWSGSYRFVNITQQSFTDSLLVKFDVVTTGIKNEASEFHIHAPAPGDTTHFSVATPTLGKAGLNDVNVFVNPKILPEQYYPNNEIDLTGYLNIAGDHITPLLDVTFDGRHLEANDFVSPAPVIKILIADENRFLFKTDTTGIRIVLTYPCADTDCVGQQIFFSRNDIKWTPASGSAAFVIEFTPNSLPDGDYSLFVQGADANGNKSGSDPYEISFRVSNENSFTFNSVYPNPSSSVFFFSFLVTGNQVPDLFKLTIYSAEGQVLQTFGPANISGFHIGDNSLAWDTTADGGVLPSGVYLYRIEITVNGETHRQVGKMILVK